ncbi:biotin-dependent carboxyltransferase family protein [Nocardia spumae]|uniref:5-oxoprolinase subunit C family protein n=1 Tax=Nocardia spumae TaxID=2887190 RepID=UPI001D1571FA|nr:biotin-dependent carboxyltransferase family protein [Nocardia spumae]
MRVLEPGASSTVQDLGRPGWFRAGVGVSGAVDRGALRLANRLVGNAESAAAIECVLGGLSVEFDLPTMVAVTGAPAPITVDGRREPPASVLFVGAGQRVRLGTAVTGLRCYLAVRGGIAVEPVLGSRSRDTMAGLGPEPLRRGDTIPVGVPPRDWPNVDIAPVAPISDDPLRPRVLLGPRADWFVNPEALFAGAWRVSADADRIGIRLDRCGGAPSLRRVDDAELPTEGMALGAIQVPPAGRPVVLLADRPITGGYPVVGTVIDADIDLLGQARPGQLVEFRSRPP